MHYSLTPLTAGSSPPRCDPTPASARRWLLIDHEAQATGGGRTYGRGHVFTEDGRLVTSFVQEALLRRFPDGQNPHGKTSTIV